jgi:hypothetical protein
MALPMEKSKKIVSIDKQIFLIYGRAKIGKSSLCSQFPNPIFFATEAGLNHLEVYQIVINSWEKFLEACAEIAKGNHEFKTIIIDTCDNLVNYCTEYICKQEKINHPADLPMGKGWFLVTQELVLKLTKLSSLPYGLVFVSHCNLETIETKIAKYNRYTVSIAGAGNRNVFLNMADIILFIDSVIESGKERRIIKTKPSRDYEAGDRSGLLPEELPLDYKELAKYFK